MESGRSPIVEPRVTELVKSATRLRHLLATADSEDAVLKREISFLCVGTPSLRNGKLDLGHIEPVCEEIGKTLKRRKISSGRAAQHSSAGNRRNYRRAGAGRTSGKKLGQGFGVCVNPEFMREGTAVADFLEPAMTIIGASDPTHSRRLREVYSWVPGKVFETSFRSAEMVKYVCNTWHAVKVAFANEVGTLAKQMGVDAESVVEIFTADTKLNISASYLKPGFAFGGSCLPKDVRALNYRAKELDLNLPLLESLMASNQQHLERAVEMILATGKRKLRCSA